MSHSDFRSTQVRAGSLGDLNNSMDAGVSPSRINTSSVNPAQSTPLRTQSSHQANNTVPSHAAGNVHSNPAHSPAAMTPDAPQSVPRERHAIPSHAASAQPAVIVDDGQIEQASHALKAMAHPLRLKILCILAASQEVSVQGLVERVGTTQSNISQHLSVLREKHVLDCRKDANKVFYRIRDERFLNVIRSVHDALH